MDLEYGHSGMDVVNFYWVCLESVIFAFRKNDNPQLSGRRGPHKWINLGPCIS